ncbi:hypothetical protein BSKO_14042 [Bryopsis sp. KO-2023]|nr:hypothetical protein BSKO_14042 [Bryopsis sp. KO-2023]
MVSPRIRELLWRSGGAGLLGLTVWQLADAVTDTLVFRQCRKQGLRLAKENAELCELLGAPLSAGPWYNASLAFSHDGFLANCMFRVDGANCSSDVTVRAIRKPGKMGNFLYCTVGAAEWKVLTCDATLALGGVARRLNLVDLISQPLGATPRMPMSHPHAVGKIKSVEQKS